MAKDKIEPVDRVAGELLVHALGQIARTVKPFPKEMDVGIATQALEKLRQAGFVHGSQREPNLTPTGVEKARELAA